MTKKQTAALIAFPPGITIMQAREFLGEWLSDLQKDQNEFAFERVIEVSEIDGDDMTVIFQP